MGFFSSFSRVFKKAVHTVAHVITHPVKDIKIAVNAAEKKILPTILKVGKEIVKDAELAVDFTIDHAGEIANVGDIAGDVLIGIGAATGQPEIAAMGGGIKSAAKVIADLGEKAKKAKTIITKTKILAEQVKHKKNLSEALHGVADIMGEAGSLTGNKKLITLSSHIKDGANITDAAHQHVELVVNSIKNKDFDGIVKGGEGLLETHKAAKELVKKVKTSKLDKEKLAIAKKITAAKTAGGPGLQTLTKKQVIAKKKNDKKKTTKKAVKTTTKSPTVAELKKMAKSAGIKGYSTMKKSQLLEVLKNPVKSTTTKTVKFTKPTAKTIEFKKTTTKKKRKPSAYNLFIKEQVGGNGLTFKEAGALWRKRT